MQAPEAAVVEDRDNANAASAPTPSGVEPEVLPRTFERRLLLKHLARGGMGEVYLAASGAIEGAERPCVVKIIRREHAEDRSFLARFLDEARVQAQLAHPGVAQVLEAATDASGKPYVVLEHVEGRNLGEARTRASQLSSRIHWADAVAIGISLGDALAHVHERTDAAGKPLEIVHRDLSPQNVMVGYAGDVKLIDFGTARGLNRRCHTVAGIVFAKPGYVAPEVANNNPGGVPADLYAYGVMLWELLAGRRFLFGDPAAHLAAVAAGKRKPAPVAHVVEAPARLDEIIAKLTASSIDERYASARAATSDLLELIKQSPVLPNGDRSVRGRIAQLMQRLYPAEPARSRAEFERLVAAARKARAETGAASSVPAPAPPSDADPGILPGTRYRIVREIGHGAMGVVHEALHLDLGRSVALKVLPKEHAQKLGARLRAEARAIAQLDHDNLVKLHDFGFASDGRPFYAMELLEGEPLDRCLEREKSMEWRQAVSIAIQACRALEAAHGAAVFHRDIKPANLFLTRSGSVKLLDFGVAKAESEIEFTPPRDGGSAIAVIGTPEYMAPEQAAGKAADARSDVYALGAVLYELVTGRPPHWASNTIGVLNAKLQRDAEPARLRAPRKELPKMLDLTIGRALERHPECRFQSAAELRAALEAALGEPDRLRARRRRFAVFAIATLAVCSAGVIAVGAAQPGFGARLASATAPIVEQIDAVRARASTTRAVPATQKPKHASPAVLPKAPPKTAPVVLSLDPPAPPKNQDVGEDDEQALIEQMHAIDSSDEESGAPDALQDPLAVELERLETLMKKGREVRALHALRELGQVHPNEPAVLQAWTVAAARTKSWGEALRVSRQWAEIDGSPEAQLYLARMLRVAGDKDAVVATLTRLLEVHPECDEARMLLRAQTRKTPDALGG
jgi:serine/threonine-protein kinase